MIKKWKLKEQVSDSVEEQLLHSLDIKSEEEKRKFFSPDYEKDLRDPFEILNMDKAVDRILEAIDKEEKIIVFGDYDADGVCGSTIFYDFFKKIDFENFSTYIPDRHKEEYGLNMDVMDEFAKQGVNLIITIDCGITDNKEIEKGNKLGIDTVVLDHHLQGEELPPAVTVVDPKQDADDYPFKMLCGAGVAFKTVNAILDKEDFNVTEGWTKWLLDVVAIATIADMVPLVDENRVLVYYGLKVLRKTHRPGLLALFKKLKMNQKNIVEDDVAFFIAPRINVASRMDHASTSYALLITKSREEAEWSADRLDRKNIERREVAGEIIETIKKEIDETEEEQNISFAGNNNWVPGVLGVAANRIIEEHKRPIFLWGKDEGGNIKGSARSDGSVNLVDLMEEADKLAGVKGGLFDDYGGHALAAGFAAKEEHLDLLKEKLQEAYNIVEKKEVEDVILADKEMDLKNVDWGFLKKIEKFCPFGMNNPKPVFWFKDLEVFGVKKFGNGSVHMELQFKKETPTGLPAGRQGSKIIPAIWFFNPNGEEYNVEAGDKIDLLANIERSTFKGYNELRLMVVDIRKNK